MVGRRLVEELAKSPRFNRVVTLGRRPVAYDGEGKEKLEQHVVDFDNLQEHASLFKGHNVGLSTMGTSSALAGSTANLEKIDYHYPLQVARLYKEANPDTPTHFAVVTAPGVSSKSWFAAVRVKGKLEDDLKALEFTQLSIFRPAILTPDPGQPPRDPPYFGEIAAQAVAKPLNFITRGRAAVDYGCVARAMRLAAQERVSAGAPRVTSYSNLQMLKMDPK
jgi:oxidoreductase